MVSRVIPVEPFDLVIFGATGDLARRKILPGLFHRFMVGQMPEEARIIGAARSDLDQQAFRDTVRKCLTEFAAEAAKQADLLDRFLDKIAYVRVDAHGDGDGGWADLAAALRKDVVRAFYLSVGPSL